MKWPRLQRLNPGAYELTYNDKIKTQWVYIVVQFKTFSNIFIDTGDFNKF